MKYKYLTFDCYGTLIDWRSGIERELRAALGNLRLGGQELLDAYLSAEREEESGYKKYREVLRRTVKSLSGRLEVEVDEAAATSFAGSVPRWPAFPDTRKFLQDVGSMGYKRYILSNVDNDLLEQTIGNNGLEVDGFVTAEEVGSYKPRFGHWERFFERTGAQRGEVLHVAQSVWHDILPAQELGLSSAWVNRYGESLPHRAEPLFITDSLANLSALL